MTRLVVILTLIAIQSCISNVSEKKLADQSPIFSEDCKKWGPQTSKSKFKKLTGDTYGGTGIVLSDPSIGFELWSMLGSATLLLTVPDGIIMVTGERLEFQPKHKLDSTGSGSLVNYRVYGPMKKSWAFHWNNSWTAKARSVDGVTMGTLCSQGKCFALNKQNVSTGVELSKSEKKTLQSEGLFSKAAISEIEKTCSILESTQFESAYQSTTLTFSNNCGFDPKLLSLSTLKTFCNYDKSELIPLIKKYSQK